MCTIVTTHRSNLKRHIIALCDTLNLFICSGNPRLVKRKTRVHLQWKLCRCPRVRVSASLNTHVCNYKDFDRFLYYISNPAPLRWWQIQFTATEDSLWLCQFPVWNVLSDQQQARHRAHSPACLPGNAWKSKTGSSSCCLFFFLATDLDFKSIAVANTLQLWVEL